ncbi:SRPBCC domain-containing protein [Candidatus Leptofilum sp.]|uniref:SRPBCC domain-containing protein n=1 Tax=Candidatus Leptofilum sp. TaxID=3241576 RepID=UPI003B5AB4C1
MSETTELTFNVELAAPPTAVYYALTNGAALREWLATNSQVATQVGGRIYLWWQQGYWATGEFLELVPEKKVVYSWQGRLETAVTKVTFSLQPGDGGTHLSLTHEDIPAGEDAAEMRQGLKDGWDAGLANLKSVLETGLDKRLYDQAFLGILISGLVTAEQAEELGIDAAGGIRISGTMAGTGAAEAGLQAEDVIIDMGGSETKDFPSLQAAIRPYRAGDGVKITYYRDGEREQTMMTLGTRPVPDIPTTPKALAEAVADVYAELDVQLDEVVANVSEMEADYRPDGDDSWNAKELLAHLITTERGMQMQLATQVTDGTLDGFPNNPAAWVRSVTAVYTTLADMVALWKRTEAESVALLANLPDAFTARKTSYLNAGNTFLNGLPPHTRSHIVEIEALLKTAREQLAHA